MVKDINSSSEYLTEDSKKGLEIKLAYLIKVKRQEISEKLEESISLGDLSENAEYHEAKEEQSYNEQRIAEIEDLLSRAIIIPSEQRVCLRIEMGCFVVLKKGGEEIMCEYQIVGSGEADPLKRKISNESPLGSSLLGKQKGDRIKVLTPRGEIEYTIEKVS